MLHASVKSIGEKMKRQPDGGRRQTGGWRASVTTIKKRHEKKEITNIIINKCS